MPAIGDPLADIAGEVVKTECIGRVRPHPRRAPRVVAIAVEGIAPMASTGRLVLAAGEVAGPLGRGAIAPGEPRVAAGAQHVLELGFARQPVRVAGLGRQPFGERLRVLRADVHNRQAVPGGVAGVVRTPVDAATPYQVAAALVIGRGVAATGRPRLVTGGSDEATELADGDLVA